MQTLSYLQRGLLELLAAAPAFEQDACTALSSPGKLLAPAGSRPSPGVWALLPWYVARYLAPDLPLQVAQLVALSVECLVCALDVLDDIEDEDRSPALEALGKRRALQVSTVLQMLAQRALLDTGGALPDDRVYQLLETLNSCLSKAVIGQHRDLLAEHLAVEQLTVEQVLEIAEGKAGALLRLACELPAVAAGAGEMSIRQWSELGELLGVASQLDNDAHDLYAILELPDEDRNEVSGGKSDLRRGKKTLPVILAAQRGPLQWPLAEADTTSEAFLREGIVLTWGICLMLKQRAEACRRQIERVRPLPPELLHLLEQV